MGHGIYDFLTDEYSGVRHDVVGSRGEAKLADFDIRYLQWPTHVLRADLTSSTVRSK